MGPRIQPPIQETLSDCRTVRRLSPHWIGEGDRVPGVRGHGSPTPRRSANPQAISVWIH